MMEQGRRGVWFGWVLLMLLMGVWMARGDDGDVLSEFYHSTSGDRWASICQNWLVQNNYCLWYGVQCNEAQRVVRIELIGCKLQGELPASLGMLTELTTLDLRHNGLYGPIPFTQLAGTRLSLLDLSDNFFSGTIPPAIGDLSNLSFLDLGNNMFTGELPDELRKLNQLNHFRVAFNQLSGPFPESVASLKSLTVLDISVNLFYGTIPKSFPANDSAYTSIALSSNAFEGTLHSDFFSYCAELTTVTLNDNYFEGVLPIEGKFCPQLAILDVTNNSFSGQLNISETFFARNLLALRASRNLFNDNIQNWNRGLLYFEKIVLIDVSTNNLTGELPSTFGQLNTLDYLYVNNNTRLRAPNYEMCHQSILNCLPSYLELDWTQLTQPVGRNFYCAATMYKGRIVTVRIDNSYFQYANCRCFSGFYWNSTLERCSECLEHGYCPGGENHDHMVPEPGYWGSPDPLAPEAFLKCPEFALKYSACNPERSLDPSKFCLPGHEGRLCSKCSPGWYPWGGQCFKCDVSSLTYILPIFGFAGLALFFLYLIKMRTAPLGSVTTLFFFLQVVNILAEMGLPLPPALTSLYEGSSAVNLRFPGGPECYMGDFNYLGRFLLVLLIPIFFLLSFLIIWGAGRIYLNNKKPRPRPFRIACRKWLVVNIRGFIFMLDFCYMIICATIFRTFLCHEDPVTGVKYMTAAPYIECSEKDGQYWTMFVFAIAFFFVYIIGIPILFGTLLYKFRNECSRELVPGHESEVTLFIGWLHCDFKPEFFFWELVMLARKAIFALAISLTSFSSYVLPVFVFVILVTSLLLHRYFRPFVTPIDNVSEEISPLVLLFNFYMALIYFIPDFTTKYLNQVGYLTVAVNLLFLIYISLVMLKNMGTVEMTIYAYHWLKLRYQQYRASSKGYTEERSTIFSAPPEKPSTSETTTVEIELEQQVPSTETTDSEENKHKTLQDYENIDDSK